MFADFGGDFVDGRASTPGHVSVVDGTETANRSVSVRGEGSVGRLTLPALSANGTPIVTVVGELPHEDVRTRDGGSPRTTSPATRA